MNNLYRRIVTMGMISFSAILAWVYCVLAYREKTAYVVCLSLVLVISLYALANAIISLHLAKQEDLKKYITDTVNQTLSAVIPDPAVKQAELDHAIESERLAKATYVQLRKVNQNLTQLAEANSYNAVKSIDNYTALTLSLKEAVTESITNTAKIIIKYNKTDNQNVIAALDELTLKLLDITQALDDITTRIDSINIVAQPHVKTILEDSVLDDTLPDGIDVFSITTETPKDTTPAISQAEEDAAVNSFFDEFETKPETQSYNSKSQDDNQIATDDSSSSSNQMLSQDDIEALFKAAMPVDEESVVEDTATPVNDDPNRQLSPDEIAALFSANAPAKEPVVEETAAVTEDPVVEETAAATPVNDDPNRQLSPDEIAALFSANAPAKEPVVEETAVATPVNDDPNRQLSPDEIAALFSANAPAKEPVVEETAVATPVNDDPNRQLSPDEIAALFSASKEERTAKSDDDFHKDNMPEAMDQSLIDALLGNLDAEAAIADEASVDEDKIIPFPIAEDPKDDGPTPIAEEFDPNKQLSADEIAALFASINGGN